MTDYKPGTVAWVTALNRSTPYRAFFDGNTWRECGEYASFCVDTPTSVRPLVVLDVTDPRRVLADLSAAIVATGNGKVSRNLRVLRDQIEAQTCPPKPPEPTGLGAVVEDAEGRQYLRVGNHAADCNDWRQLDGGVIQDDPRMTWPEVPAVRIVHKGAQPC